MFDAVRNRKRGEEARQRVLDRTYSPAAPAAPADDMFAAVRNRDLSAPVMSAPAVDPVTSQLLRGTLAGVGITAGQPTIDMSPKAPAPQPGIDFKAAQSQSPLTGKLPAPGLLQTPKQTIQSVLADKVPAASLLQQTGRGPDNASQIPELSQYEINKREIASAPPVIKQYAQAMNYLTEGNPLGIAIGNAFSGNSEATRRDSSGNKTVDKAADLINSFITPLLLPTGAPVGMGPNVGTYEVAGKALASKPGQAAVNKIAQGIGKIAPKVSPNTAQTIARQGLTETVAGPLQGVGIGLVNQQDSDREIGMNALYGAAGGAVLGFGGAAAGAGLRNLFKRSGIPDAEIEELLALPEGRGTVRQAAAVGRSNLAAGTEPVINPYTYELPEASARTRAAADNATGGRSSLREIDQSIHSLQTSYEQAVIDEYKLLRQQLDNRGGVQQGALQRTPEGEVIGRTGRQSNNPRWYQEFYAANGKRPTIKDLYTLARDRVDNGFADEAGRVPSWRERTGYDEQMAGYQQARETLAGSLRDIDPALQVVDTPLVGQELRDLRRTGPKHARRPVGESLVTPPSAEPTIQRPAVAENPLSYNVAARNNENRIPTRADYEAQALRANDVSDLSEGVGNFGKGISDGLYDNLWSKIVKGQTTENGQQSAILQVAKAIKERGGMKDISELRRMAKDYTDVLDSGVKGSDYNKALSAVVEKYTPAAKTAVREAEEAVEAVTKSNVRDKVYTLLDDAEKAARDRIAKRRGNINSNPLPEWADYSIIMAAKLGKGTIKAANFAEELVKEFGESVRPHADQILRMTKEEIRKQERLASKEGRFAAAANAVAEGDAASFAEKVSRTVPDNKKPFAERWQRWRTQFSEDLAALEIAERKLRGGKLASAEDSLYKSARLFKGAPERAAQIVETRLGPVIKQAEAAGYAVEDLEHYALAKHAQDMNKAGYESGFTNQEIKDVLDSFDSPEMVSAHKALLQVNKDMMQELVDSGVVSKDLQDVLADRWKNYIPMFREFDDDKVGFAGGMSKSLANVTAPIKALQGSKRKVIRPLENMVKNIFQSVNAAERNKVASQIPKLAKLDSEGQFIRKVVDKHYATVRSNGENLRYEIEPATFEKISSMTKEEKQALAAEMSGDPNATFTRTSSVEPSLDRKNVVKVKVGGNDELYEVEPEIYKAIMNLDKESSNTLMNMLAKPASLLRAGATLTPEFALRNPIRDINAAYVASESGFNPITDFGAGLIQTIKKGPLYREWIDNLGAYGNTLSMDRKVHQQALKTVLKEGNTKKFVNVINGKGLIHLLRMISDTTESATKVGEYRAALRSGATPQEAAYRSRDLMDFAKAGSSIRQANKIVAFLNANIQGKSKLVRAIKADPVGVTTRALTSVTIPTAAIFLHNQLNANETQRDTLDNAPDWQKDSFWMVAIPGTDKVARIPKPFDLAAVFANLPERALEFVVKKDKAAFDGFARRSLKDASLPSQISGMLPFIEGMANYSFFREGPIIPRAEQGLEWADQYDPIRTTETAKFLAKGAEALTGGKGSLKNFSSPRVVDSTLQGLTAGLGKYATDAIDILLKGSGIVDRPSAPAKRAEQLPVIRSFLVDSEQGGKNLDKFYQMKDALTKEKASAKLNEKPFVKQGVLDSITDVSDTLSDINKAIKAIERGGESAAVKKSQIDPLVKRRNEMIKRTMEYLNKYK